jgi:hypothetical protein
MDDAHVAQSVEHFLGKEEVTGSNPVVGFQTASTGARIARAKFGARFQENRLRREYQDERSNRIGMRHLQAA